MLVVGLFTAIPTVMSCRTELGLDDRIYPCVEDADCPARHVCEVAATFGSDPVCRIPDIRPGSDPCGPEPALNSYHRLVGGGDAACGLHCRDGAVICWDRHGVETVAAGPFKDYALAYDRGCGLQEDGTPECWGIGTDPLEVEHSDYDYDQGIPPDGARYVAIDATTTTTCGLTESGSIECWGNTDPGGASPPDETFRKFENGGCYACGITIEYELLCWGCGDGSGTSLDGDYGQALAPAGRFVDLSLQAHYGCALERDGTPRCWGLGDEPNSRPLSEGNEGTWDFDQAIPPEGPFVVIDTGSRGSCGIRPSGSIDCWGHRELDEGIPSPELSFSELSVGSSGACATNEEGKVVCWGPRPLMPP